MALLPVQCLPQHHRVRFQDTYHGGWTSLRPLNGKCVPSEFLSIKCSSCGGLTFRSRIFRRIDTVSNAHTRNRWTSASASVNENPRNGEGEIEKKKSDEFSNDNGSGASSSHNSLDEFAFRDGENNFDEFGNNNGSGTSSSRNSLEEFALREGENSLDSIEGLARDRWSEKEFEDSRSQTLNHGTNVSLDSIEGVGLASNWSNAKERGANDSLDSIEGLTSNFGSNPRDDAGTTQKSSDKKARDDANSNPDNSEWKNVFPSYMQSKQTEVEQSPDGDGDGAVGSGSDPAVDNPRRVSRPAGATEAAVAAVASVKEFDSQFGSQLLSSASPVPTSNRGGCTGNPAESGKLEDLISHDPIWAAIRAEARLEAEREPLLSSFLYASILAHSCFERSLGFVLANRLKNATLLATQLLDVFDDVFVQDSYVRQAIRLDAQAVKDRDPACRSYIWALLYLKGYHALQAYRIAHALWCRGQRVLAFALQSRISEVFAVDIHPAARLGKAILLDHGTGVVIGETAVVGDRVSLLQGVTLGGTGKMSGDRHPKIKEGVLIGAGATILGNITVGKGAMVASGSLVLKDVPPHSMVAGTPAKVVGYLDESVPSLTMNQDATKDFCQDYQERHQAMLESRLEGGAGI